MGQTLKPDQFSESGSVFFRWNQTDLSQFNSVVLGDNATGSTAAVVSYAGENWVGLTLTHQATASNQRQNMYLPINVVPPSANYTTEADIAMITFSADAFQLCGAILGVRWASTISGYILPHLQVNATGILNFPWQVPQKLVSPETGNSTSISTLATNLRRSGGKNTVFSTGTADVETVLAGVNEGWERVVFGAQGTGATVSLRRRVIDSRVYSDASSPITSVGKPTLGMTGHNNSATRTHVAYFKNIICREIL